MRTRKTPWALIFAFVLSGLVFFEASAAPAQIERLRVTQLRPTYLNPVFSVEEASNRVVIQLFSGLVAYSVQKGYYGDLAESWETSEDGTVYRFTLRSNARWSDGAKITGAEIVASFKLLAKIGGSRTLYDFSLAETKVLNAGEKEIIEFTLPARSPRFLTALAYPSGAVLPLHIAENVLSEPWTVDDMPENIPFSGPYQIESSDYERMSLVANPHYHSPQEVNVARVELTWLSGDSDQMAIRELMTKEIDIAHVRSAGQAEFLYARMPDYIAPQFTRVVDYLILNTKAPPFDDLEIRKALTYAMAGGYPREFVEAHFLVPRRSLMPVIMAQEFGDAYPYWANTDYSELLDRAVGIMAERGYSETNPLPITLQVNTNSLHLRMANLARAKWKAAFFETAIKDRKWSDYVPEVVETGKYQVFRYGWIYDYNHPLSMLETFHSNSNAHGPVYANPKFDAVVEELRQATDPAEINQLTEKAYGILFRDYAVIPLYGFGIGATLLLRQPSLEFGEVTFQGYPRYKSVRRASEP